MKKMKRAAALLLALLMMLSLCACGKSELAGTWEGRMDLTELVLQEVDETVGQMGISLSGGRELPQIKDYVDLLDIKYTIVFNEDGTYSSQVTQEDLDALAETLKAGIDGYLRQLYFVLLCETLYQMGFTQEINSIEELENFLGITMDEALEESLGMSMDDYMDALMEESFSSAISPEDLSGSGNYKAKDGKLYLSDGLEYQVDPAVYDLYQLEGDVMTIEAGTAALEEGMESVYPMVLNRVA